MKISFCGVVLTLSLFVFFNDSCFCAPEYDRSHRFVDFLLYNKYLSGNCDILQKDHVQYVFKEISHFGVNGIINGDLPTADYVTSIAFIAAQVKKIDIATQLLMMLYKAGSSNWLFEKMELDKKKITKKSIKAALIESYDPIWREQQELRTQRHDNSIKD